MKSCGRVSRSIQIRELFSPDYLFSHFCIRSSVCRWLTVRLLLRSVNPRRTFSRTEMVLNIFECGVIGKILNKRKSLPLCCFHHSLLDIILPLYPD